MNRLLANESGSALLLSVIVGFVFLTAIVWSSNWGYQQEKFSQKSIAAQRALQYADSGISASRPWLKRPSADSQLPPGGTNAFTTQMPQGRYEVSMYRSITDTSLVDIYSTGYYYISSGAIRDGATGQNAQIAAIHAIVRVTNVGAYLAAVPGDLSISEGAQAGSGIVYAQNLTFVGTPGDLPSTVVGEADYGNTVLPSVKPSFVTFNSSSGQANKLSYPPTFAQLDSDTRSYYQSIASHQATPTTYSGTVSAPTDCSVYFVDGDVNLGAPGTDLNVNGNWVVYATGNIYIQANITVGTGSWAAFLSEKDIHITANAPDALTLNGTFVGNGVLTADTPSHPRVPGTITFTGGMVMMSGINLTTAYTGTKTYTYYSSPNPAIVLPNFTDLWEKNIYLGSGSFK